ncbi:SIS domain-containing protein [Rudaeicoccus suwonensis]|uniref:Fructoselysine-6-P-deglycase FrlB-like protein n=1 Tax=Rudaeicoccus suwonensis TaxID=657409 RepID=A0A561E9C4_9MICO|nr:SIS domain-containing protein [Rudaeicoccus suwonensis]TWE12212.1 fructoselysine-6-P-deglycase FrlB-like protein [Rudaeicoccus suwonensis]
MPFNPHSHLRSEVLSEPDTWQAVLGRLQELAPMLPARGARVAVVGCGTSYFMAQAYAVLREQRGYGETDAFAASEFPAGRDYDHLLAISRSGTTTEVIDLLTAARRRDVRTTAIVATGGTPVTELAHEVVLLPEADEKSVVQTRFATSALALLRASLGEDLSQAVAEARAVLAEDETQALNGLADAEQVTFVGTGWTVGIATEAALKLRESAQFWSESYPAMEYRHGPVAIASSGRAVWAFGVVPDGLAAQVEATGAHFEHRDIDPLADLVRVHRLCLFKARALDLDPDNPRHLTRSVILTVQPA